MSSDTLQLSDKALTPNNTRTAQLVARNINIATDYVRGLSRDELSAKYGIKTRQIHNILSTDEAVKEIIAHAIKHNVQGLPKALREHDSIITDKEADQAVKLRAIDLRYKITGVSPTHTSNPVLQQIYVDNRVTVNSGQESLQKYAAFKLTEGLDDDTQDAEYETQESEPDTQVGQDGDVSA